MRRTTRSLRQRQENALAALARQCRDLDDAADLHSQVERSGLLDSSTFLGNLLIQMYGRCGSVESARRVFDGMRGRRNVFSWNILLAAHGHNGDFASALRLFLEMDLEGEVRPDAFTYASVIGACSSNRCFAPIGVAIHECVVDSALEWDAFVGTALITMYGKLEMLDHARAAFDAIPNKDIVAWNATITAFAQSGNLESALEAVDFLAKMESEGVKLDAFTLLAVVSAITQLGILHQGVAIHDRILALGIEAAESLQNALVFMYAKCGSVDRSQEIFDRIHEKDVVAWTAMISAFAMNGQSARAMELFLAMDLEGVQPTVPTFTIVLTACSTIARVRQLHACLDDRGLAADTVAATALITAYSDFFSLEESRRVFDDLRARDTACWNSILAACVECGSDRRFRVAACEMELEGARPNPQTLMIRIEACSRLASLDLDDARGVHAMILACGYTRRDELLTALITMYSRFGRLDEARRAFHSHGAKNVVTWTALIGAYTQHGHSHYARALFQAMEAEGVEPDTAAYASGIFACYTLDEVEKMHVRVSTQNLGDSAKLRLGTALVAMYGSCRSPDRAADVFAAMPVRDSVAFHAMSSALVENAGFEQAISLLEEMEAQGIHPAPATIVNAVNSCTLLGELKQGRRIHRRLEELHDAIFPVVVTALLNLYGRCGCLDEARALFRRPHRRTVASWNSMIAAFSQHGHLRESLDLVHDMQLHGALPDKFTYIEILQACSHSGTVDLGRSYFLRMGMDHGLIPSIEHYVSVVDLLGRIGQLEQAEGVVKGLPYEPDMAAWNSLLGSCNLQGDCPRAQETVGSVLKLEADCAAPYVLLANLYAAAGRWEDVAIVRRAMAQRGIRKPSGRSFQCI